VATDSEFPIVCLDRDYRITSTFSDVDRAVRIRPDDWPTYADDAWITIELARSEAMLGAFVIEGDRERMERAS
jgi:hypothetical protein